MNTESIGKKIQRLRKEKGLTQEELASSLSVSAQAVSKWENDYSCPDISVLPRLAEKLGVTVDELLNSEAGGGAREGEFIASPEKEEESAGTKPSFQFEYRREWKRGKVWGGIFVVLAGLYLVLCGTNVIEVSFWSLLWPTAIICAGLSGTLSRDINGFYVALCLFGAYFLLNNIGIMPESFSGTWLILGAVLIVCGILTILPKKKKHWKYNGRGGTDGGKSPVKKLSCTDGYISYEAAFCEDKACFGGDTLRGGSAEATFGDYTIDLSGVKNVADGATLNVEVAFGTLTLLMPATVKLNESRDTGFASVNIHGSPAPDAPYILNINSAIAFGSLEIKYL